MTKPSGADRQDFAREANQRMLAHMEAAETAQSAGRAKEYRRQMALAKREMETRNRYDDAGEFAVSQEEQARAQEAADIAGEALRKLGLR